MRPQGEARALFAAHFGGAPVAVASAPGRVNLIGEHTDYNDGLVLPVPLPLGTTVALGPRDDGRLEAVSALDGQRRSRAMDEGPDGSWTDYR
ncbi:MAG: galactokinase, partial [Alphaproteobacteria bacterium]